MPACIHCGLDCGKHPVIWDEKPFCCDGCAMVYRILNEKKLDRYYEIMPTPGIKIEQTDFGGKYAYLDKEEFYRPLLEFSDGGISKITFFVPAIHCSSCIWLLENLNQLHPGILQSHVHFVRKEVGITFREQEISVRQLVELLHSIHYIPELTYKKKEKDDHQAVNRRLLMKIGVAGFAFGNIMLISFPDYLPGGEKIDQFLVKAFGYLSFALALPVIFYCSTDFFKSAFKNLRKGIINIDLPISLGIIALFLESSYEIFSHSGTGYMDSLAGLLFFMLTGRWYQSKSYQSLSFERDYQSYFPVAVTRIYNGTEEFVPLKDLKKGDLILIRNQELIPADSVIEEGLANIDYSFVTGESFPVVKNEGDYVFAGGRQQGTSIKVRVEKEVAQSYLTRLWNEDRHHSKHRLSMQKLINKVSQYFTIIILVIGFSAGLYWYASGSGAGKAIYVFSSVLIVACPCALALTIPFTFGNTIRVFGRNGFYLKNSDLVEVLAKSDTVVFDKTGTITHARQMRVDWQGVNLTKEELSAIRALVKQSTHPASVAISESIDMDADAVISNFKEIPSLGIAGMANGMKILVGSHKLVAGTEQPETATTTEVYVSINSKIKGFFRLENRYRENLNTIIGHLSEYELHLLTGDNDSEKANLLAVFGPSASLHFRQSPADKLHYVENLVNSGKNVIMIGDGLNDAGALMKSGMGITIADDIFHFSPACDAILESKQFYRLHEFIGFAGKALKVVYLSYAISFLYNIIGLSFAVRGVLSPVVAAILMPLSSVSIVAFTSLSVLLLARSARFVK